MYAIFEEYVKGKFTSSEAWSTRRSSWIVDAPRALLLKYVHAYHVHQKNQAKCLASVRGRPELSVSSWLIMSEPQKIGHNLTTHPNEVLTIQGIWSLARCRFICGWVWTCQLHESVTILSCNRCAESQARSCTYVLSVKHGTAASTWRTLCSTARFLIFICEPIKCFSGLKLFRVDHGKAASTPSNEEMVLQLKA